MITSTITLSISIKKQLDGLKRHPRESYNDVLARMLNGSQREYGTSNLRETIAVLSDPSLMKGIAKGLKDMHEGRLHHIDDL